MRFIRGATIANWKLFPILWSRFTNFPLQILAFCYLGINVHKIGRWFSSVSLGQQFSSNRILGRLLHTKKLRTPKIFYHLGYIYSCLLRIKTKLNAFKNNFLYVAEVWVYYFPCRHLVVPAPFVEMISFLHWTTLALLFKINWLYSVGLIMDSLFHMSIFMPVLLSRDYCGFIVSLEIR